MCITVTLYQVDHRHIIYKGYSFEYFPSQNQVNY